MKWVLALALATFAALLPAETAKAKAPQASSSSVKKKSATAPHTSAHSSHARHSRSRRAAHTGPAYQLHPDASRYAEIQKALADRGYFKGEANGQWGDDSVDALKRFQADQKLDNTGKIDSLTLIGLGLGPKHDGSLARPGAASPSAAPLTPPPQPVEQAVPASEAPPDTPK